MNEDEDLKKQLIGYFGFLGQIGYRTSYLNSVSLNKSEANMVKKVEETPQSIPAEKIPIQNPDKNVNREMINNKKTSPTPLQNDQFIQQIFDCKTLDSLKNLVCECEGPTVKKYAKNTVFADGDPDSEIMFIGEAPGEEEDIKGVPFCGKSGQLLSNALEAVNLTREKDYYITNSFLWRPPGNRKPTDEEINFTRPILHRHIQIVKPKLIVTVGAVPLNALLGIDTISKARGNVKEVEISDKILPNDQLFATIISSFESNIEDTACAEHLTKIFESNDDRKVLLLPIYHPSYILRSPGKKKDMYIDMLKIRFIINLLRK